MDINECVRGTAACPANAGCVNSNGSYACPCFFGHQLAGAQAPQSRSLWSMCMLVYVHAVTPCMGLQLHSQ